MQDGITSVGNYAFQNCSGIKGDLIIPDTVTSIGEGAFYCCSGIDGELKLSNSLKEINYRAFCRCSNVTGELVIPDSVETINHYAFGNDYSSSSSYTYYGMTKVTSLVIGENVKAINSYSWHTSA